MGGVKRIAVVPFQGQRGVTLLLAIMVVLALSFAALGLVYFVRYDSEASSNVAAHTEAMQATEVGLEAANTDLQNLSQFPELMSMTGQSWYYVPVAMAPGPPLPPTLSFWNSCLGAKQCAEVTVPAPGTARPGQMTFNVEYIVSPGGLPAQMLNGAGQGTGPVTSYMTYLCYVNAEVSNTGLSFNEYHRMNSDIEATLRKVP